MYAHTLTFFYLYYYVNPKIKFLLSLSPSSVPDFCLWHSFLVTLCSLSVQNVSFQIQLNLTSDI
jgi:hypothetical protein